MELMRALPLLLLLVVCGCAKNEAVKSEGSELAVADAIDIGQVRVKDSPVATSFSVANHSSVSAEIDEIQSGCGCTVIDLPQKTIRAGETLDVPVKIDLFGRKGEFNADLLVRFKSGELRHIRILGTIIDDLWYSGQSIRFYIGQDQEVVSKDFSISTVDYPDIQFEIDTNDPDVRLSELSRSSQSGETRILFQLIVQNANKSRTSSRIDLIPTNVDLPKLTVPVFYHHLSGSQKQYLATSQINLGEVKRNENLSVKVYGDRSFLRGVHKVLAVSQDDVISAVSHAMPTDSDYLEVMVSITGHQGLVRGSLVLFSHDDNEATVQVSGIVVSE